MPAVAAYWSPTWVPVLADSESCFPCRVGAAAGACALGTLGRKPALVPLLHFYMLSPGSCCSRPPQGSALEQALPEWLRFMTHVVGREKWRERK